MKFNFSVAKSLATLSFKAIAFAMVAVISLTAIPSGLAQEKEESKAEQATETESFEDQIDQLKEKLTDEVEKLSEEYHDAETLDERKALSQRRREFEKLIVEDAIGLIRKMDAERQRVKTIGSLLEMQVKGEARTSLLKEIQTNHKKSKELGPLLKSLAKVRTPTQEIEDVYRHIIKHNPNENVKAQTTFALYQYLDGLKERTFGAKRGSYFASRSDNQIDAEVDKLLDDCVEKYADVKNGKKTYGELASKILQVRNIKVGKIAPDIEGVDLDDVAFKLSDYRGKVVVIDFWGDW